MKKVQMKVSSIKQLYEDIKNKGNGKVKAIIMTSYDVNESKLNGVEYLLLNFDDVKIYGRNSFNENYAKKVHKFVYDLESDIDVLYFCCDSGESRSSAVMAATYRYLNINDKEIWKNPKYHPNPLVYEIMCKEYGVRLWQFELKHKININKNSLKKAIALARRQSRRV